MKNIFKKVLALLFFMQVFVSTSHGQRIEVEWGPSIKSPKNSHVTQIAGVDDDGFYVQRDQQKGLLSLGRSSYFIERFDNNFKRVFNKELQMPGRDPNEMVLEDLMYLDGRLLMFSSYFNRKTLDHYAFASPIDKEGVVSEELQEVDKIEAKNRRRTGNFDFVISPDSTRILVYHDEPFERREKERFNIKIFDRDLYELSTAEVVLPYDDVDAEIIEKLVDDSGKVYMLLRINKERGERIFRPRNYRFLVVLIEPSTEVIINEYDLSLGRKFISEAGMRLDENGDLIASGLYSERSESRAKGIFYMKLDGKSKEVIAGSTQEFDSRFIADVSGNRRVRDNRELENFRLDHIEFLDDGSTVIVAEQYFVMVTSNTTPDGVMTNTYHYYHNDIIVANIDVAGEIKWVAKVPKRQHTINQDEFSGYAFGHSKKNLFFIYNDHKRNTKVKDERRLKYFNNPRNAVVMLAVVNEQGEVEKTPLFSAREQKTYTVPRVSFQRSDDEIIIYGIRGRFYKFGKIKILD